MDLQVYYKKIRELEKSFSGPSVVVVSRDTPDGGREGVSTEVSRHIAAKMIVENTARPATESEDREFQEQKAEAKRKADQLAAASRMKFAVVSAAEMRNLKSGRSSGE